ncbi:MAG: hypothetical protein ACXADA_15640 [Candidatus Hodarchaeales archaeon]|jgi:hypothetical protein
MKIRQVGHQDILDCWIAATAPVKRGMLLTEDIELKKAINNVPEMKDTTVTNWKNFRKTTEGNGKETDR